MKIINIKYFIGSFIKTIEEGGYIIVSYTKDNILTFPFYITREEWENQGGE